MSVSWCVIFKWKIGKHAIVIVDITMSDVISWPAQLFRWNHKSTKKIPLPRHNRLTVYKTLSTGNIMYGKKEEKNPLEKQVKKKQNYQQNAMSL